MFRKLQQRRPERSSPGVDNRVRITGDCSAGDTGTMFMHFVGGNARETMGVHSETKTDVRRHPSVTNPFCSTALVTARDRIKVRSHCQGYS